MATAGAAGTAAVSDGDTTLSMQDIVTEAELADLTVGTITYDEAVSTCTGTGCGVQLPQVSGTPDDADTNTLRLYNNLISALHTLVLYDGDGDTGFSVSEDGAVAATSVGQPTAQQYLRLESNDTFPGGILFPETTDETDEGADGVYEAINLRGVGAGIDLNANKSFIVTRFSSNQPNAPRGTPAAALSDAAPGAATYDTGTKLCELQFHQSFFVDSTVTCVPNSCIEFQAAVPARISCAAVVAQDDYFQCLCNVP
jgi:hypothetical protein